MNKIFKFFAFCLVFLQILSVNPIFAKADEFETKTNSLVEINELSNSEKIAITHIKSILKNGNAGGLISIELFRPWANGFAILDSNELFDENGNNYADVVNLITTNGTKGFVVVGIADDWAPIIEFSLTENFIDHPISNGMIRSNIELPPEEAINSSKTASISNDIINVFELKSEMSEKIGLIDNFETETIPLGLQFTQAVMESSNSSFTTYASGITVPNAGSVSYVTTSDFSGYKNHCGPTAAMNILKYYDGSGRLPGQYNSSYFKKFYDNMSTNRPAGVLWTFDDGFSETLRQIGNNSYSVYFTSNSWSNYKNLINNGYPVPMLFLRDNWHDATSDWSRHWVVGTAWLEDTYNGNTNEYAYVANGWQRDLVFRSVGRNNSAPADQLVYVNVGWNY